jgi:hypothetical protein
VTRNVVVLALLIGTSISFAQAQGTRAGRGGGAGRSEVSQRGLRQLTPAILPLRKNAPIYMARQARPDFGGADNVVALKAVEIIPCYRTAYTPAAP